MLRVPLTPVAPDGLVYSQAQLLAKTPGDTRGSPRPLLPLSPAVGPPRLHKGNEAQPDGTGSALGLSDTRLSKIQQHQRMWEERTPWLLPPMALAPCAVLPSCRLHAQSWTGKSSSVLHGHPSRTDTVSGSVLLEAPVLAPEAPTGCTSSLRSSGSSLQL